jgi:hypothetical protein
MARLIRADPLLIPPEKQGSYWQLIAIQFALAPDQGEAFTISAAQLCYCHHSNQVG